MRHNCRFMVADMLMAIHARMLGLLAERHALIAACANDGSAFAVATEDDAERVTDRVGEDPEASLAFTRQAGGAQGE